MYVYLDGFGCGGLAGRGQGGTSLLRRHRTQSLALSAEHKVIQKGASRRVCYECGSIPQTLIHFYTVVSAVYCGGRLFVRYKAAETREARDWE